MNDFRVCQTYVRSYKRDGRQQFLRWRNWS